MKHRNRSYQRCAVTDRQPASPALGALSEKELLLAIGMVKREKYSSYTERASVLIASSANMALLELQRRFRVRNEIGPSLFKSPHWQTLFEIEYPGVGGGLVK